MCGGPGDGPSVAGCAEDMLPCDEHHIKAEPTYVAYRWGKPLGGDTAHLHNGSPAKLSTCTHSDSAGDMLHKDYASGLPFGDRQLCTPLLTKGAAPTTYGHALPHCNCCQLNANRCLHKESLPTANNSPHRRTNSVGDTLDKFPTGGEGGGVGGGVSQHYLIFDPDVIPDQTRSTSSASASNVRKPLSTFLGKKASGAGADAGNMDNKNAIPLSVLRTQSAPPPPTAPKPSGGGGGGSGVGQPSSSSASLQQEDPGVPIGACPRHSGTNQSADTSTCNGTISHSLTGSQKASKEHAQSHAQSLKKSHAAAASLEDLENDANERKKLEVYTWK